MTSLTTPSPSTVHDGPEAEDLAEQLFAGATAALELATIHLGLRLGLYEALRDHGPITAAGLGHRAGIDARYAREWLEQQAMAQLVTCVTPDAAEDERVYALPASSTAVLLDPTDPAYLGPLADLTVGLSSALPELAHAYRTGRGVPFDRYGDELRHGLGTLNGATFDRALPGWVAALPDIDRRLRHGARRPRILDVGCGVGRSTLALARAYPQASVRGLDLDGPSIDAARDAAADAGLAHRVTFTVGDAALLEEGDGDRYDLVTIFEALHDLGDPVGALAAASRVRSEGGAVLVADQLTRDRFVADGDELERFQYGCSVLHCLPATRAEEHVVAHGTVLRPATVDAWARAAGLPGATVLDIEDPFWRFYRL
jgi:SAM-dependent methyltransferase